MLLVVLIFWGFGLIIGSFLNVFILRKGIEPLTGRSHCTSCGKVLSWRDLVPVFSWILLRGRCRACGSKISIQYPLVEFTNAALYALIGAWAFLNLFEFSILNLIQFATYLAIVSLLLAITVYDMRHTIIPDEWVIAFGILALSAAFLFPLDARTSAFEAFVAGPIAAAPLFFLWLISGGRWMGLGDPKLALGIGWLLGFPPGLISIFFSFILGSAILVPLLVTERIITHMRSYQTGSGGLTMKSEVPFGPFLIGSALIVWFLHIFGIQLPLELFGL
jgi:prepilin signal peptidase PulO-like enzyme (type II secretory pathway)